MKENHKKILSVLLYSMVAIMSVALLIVFMNNKSYHKHNDAFYYQAVADSLRQTGQLRNMALIPSEPIVTPQNGIVLIQYVLSRFPVSPEQRLIIIVMINYAALLCSVFPLLKIARSLGLSTLPVRFALTAVHLCGWHIIRHHLYPNNDGIFAAGSLWLIYNIILLTKNNSGLGELLRYRKLLFLATVIISMAVIHFRINAIVIPFAALFAVILTKKYKLVLPISILAMMMFLSILLLYVFCDIAKLQSTSDRIMKSLVYRLPGNIWNSAVISTPGVLFKNIGTAGNMLYFPFFLAMLITFFDGFRNKKFDSTFVALICIFTFILLVGLLFSPFPYRYLIMVYPLLYIMLLKKPAFRAIGYLFVFAVVTHSLMWCFYSGVKKPSEFERIRFWSFVSENVDIDKSDYILIGPRRHSRHAYYFTGLRVFNEQEYDPQVLNKNKIYLAGPRSFRTQQLTRFNDVARENNYSVNLKNLTENFNDDNENTFLEIHIVRP